MSKKSKIKVIISLLIAVFIGIATIGYIYNKPHTDVSQSKASMSLTSTILLNDFENDEAKANTKYLDQIIEVTGVVTDLSTSGEKTIITFGNKQAMGTVLCHTRPGEQKKAKNIRKGDSIIIKGICTGYLMDVVLIECVIEDNI